jgi:hypothetical protein
MVVAMFNFFAPWVIAGSKVEFDLCSLSLGLVDGMKPQIRLGIRIEVSGDSFAGAARTGS